MSSLLKDVVKQQPCAAAILAMRPLIEEGYSEFVNHGCVAWITADKSAAHRASLRVRAYKSCCLRATLRLPTDLAESLLPLA
jgi:hypothetical protein